MSFYDIFVAGLAHPVSNRVLDYVIHNSFDICRGAVFAMRRISPSTFGARTSFSCEMLLETEGDCSRRSLARFDPKMLKNSDLALRALEPASHQHILLFLYSEDPEKICNVRLDFEELRKTCTTNRCGIATLRHPSLEDLCGEVIHATLCESPNGHMCSRLDKLNLLLALNEQQN